MGLAIIGMAANRLREERQREKNSVSRPSWHKPFSLRTIFAGFGLVTAISSLLVVVLHYAH